MIKPQPLLCTPACCYEFHALVVHPHPTFKAPLGGSAFGIWLEVWWSFFVETVNVLRLLAIFAEELHHWCLTELQMQLCLRRFPPLKLHKRILNSPCLLILWIHTKHKNYKMKSWTDPTSSFPWRRTDSLVT